uniref:(northern house mosquito) hypothetical protein n=1 Tax=Culex pipiens TaxID=7175 RepID=A0A8D8F3U6_CULPI
MPALASWASAGQLRRSGSSSSLVTSARRLSASSSSLDTSKSSSMSCRAGRAQLSSTKPPPFRPSSSAGTGAASFVLPLKVIPAAEGFGRMLLILVGWKHNQRCPRPSPATVPI